VQYTRHGVIDFKVALPTLLAFIKDTMKANILLYYAIKVYF
jgi:hypothetical protein